MFDSIVKLFMVMVLNHFRFLWESKGCAVFLEKARRYIKNVHMQFKGIQASLKSILDPSVWEWKIVRGKFPYPSIRVFCHFANSLWKGYPQLNGHCFRKAVIESPSPLIYEGYFPRTPVATWNQNNTEPCKCVCFSYAYILQ